MKDRFYNHAPVVLCTTVTILLICSYFINIYVPVGYKQNIYILLSISCILGSIILGLSIKTLFQNITTDTLTGLKSKSFFYQNLGFELLKAQKRNSPLSLLMIDIDKFKPINDTYGHLAGDIILKQMAGTLKRAVGIEPSVIRWGGEEFAIILPNMDLKSASELAETIRCIVENTVFSYKYIQLNLTVSIGVASTSGEVDIETFLIAADQMLYKAKEKRNFVESFLISAPL